MKEQEYKKGKLLSEDEIKNLVNTGIKVLCEDTELPCGEFLGTIVKGEFLDCKGCTVRHYHGQPVLRFEEAQDFYTYDSGMSTCEIYEAVSIEPKQYKKGNLLFNREIESLANTGKKVLYINDFRPFEETLSTIVTGEFETCKGRTVERRHSPFCVRFEEENSVGNSICTSLRVAKVYEAIEVETEVDEVKSKNKFIENSGIILDNRGDNQCELVCNYRCEETFMKYISKGSSFYLIGSTDNLGFSIEKAIDIRDYLDEMIGVAKDNGYVRSEVVPVEVPKPKEMTIEEIEEHLGYKIKVV